jgi:lipoprotein-anchoring transpeptidase ErfK/SrfK
MSRFAVRFSAITLSCLVTSALAATPDAPPAGATELGIRPAIVDAAPATPADDGNDELAMTLAPLTSAAAVLSPFVHHAVGPKLQIRVDLSEQRMTVLEGGKVRYVWPVSTARPGYKTPTGFWSPYRMHVMWHSRKYDNAPMPHSIFFHEGFAIHATPYVRRLGTPASHGCVRLHPDNATILFALVRKVGPQATRVSIEK